MRKLDLLLGPKAEIDDQLFKVAPLQTLRVFSAQLNKRLMRLEVIVIMSIGADFAMRSLV